MNIKYRKLLDETRPEGYSFYPLLRIYLRQQINMQYVLALVDSGSADCVFPASVADLLRIDVRSGQPQTFHGFDLSPVVGYIHKIQVQVAGFTHWVTIDAVFLESDGMAILGQRGFFEHYQVVFERWARHFEINTRADAMIRKRRGYRRY